MFKPKNIVELKEKIDYLNEKESFKYYDNIELLGIFEKRKIKKIRNLIYDIARVIENDSSWVYADKTFVYKNNFRFDKKTNDIIYDLNTVQNIDGVYISINNNDKEKEFIKKYRTLLNKLATFEIKRDDFYIFYEHEDSNIIDFKEASMLLEKEKRKNNNKKRDEIYIQNKADYFYKTYGLEGIIELVKLLNSFEKSDVELTYNKFIYSNKSNTYKEEFSEWLRLYSNSYQNYVDLVSSVNDYRQIENEKKDKYMEMAELIYKYRL